MTVDEMELLTKFAEQNRSGAQGCFMDYDAAQALALAIDAALAALRSSAVGAGAREMMELADEIESRRGKDLYMMQPDRDLVVAALRASAVGAMREPTEAMLNAARDWSRKKYGKPVGNDGAIGCWQAMIDAAPQSDPVRRTIQQEGN